MSIQVNIFNSGSVPTATELANFISELNTDLDSIVTLTTEQVIEGAKTFWGSKMLKFKQKTSADKLGFTFYDYQGKEVGNFEYDNKNNFRFLALGNYFSAANQEIEGYVGFKVYNKSALSAYRLLCPLAGNAKNSIPSLTDTYTNFYMPLVFTNGAVSVTTDNNGKVDLSTLIGSGSGSGSGDVSGLATVATTGNYNDLLNKPALFSGNYNDLTNKPTLFSGSYGDLTDKPTLFSGDYDDLTNKPTIPVVDITKAQADEWYQPKGDYALTEDLFSGDYTDLTNKPTIPTNLSDLTSDNLHRLVTDALISTWNSKSDFSGSYNDLTDKPIIPSAQVNSDWNSSSGVSQILNKPNLATVATSGSYNDLSDKPTIPTIPTIPDSLSDLSDDSTHRLVTDTEKTTWNNKSDFSGSYNDLTNKPTIPTVPAISTNITSDATSDTKTASPKAVKDFVEGKGYLTQHQDISGKADQTDLEALEDRIDALEQGGSGSGSSITVDSTLNSSSVNPVQNRVLYSELRTEYQDALNGDMVTSITYNGHIIPVVYLNANTFNTVIYNGIIVHIIPELEGYYDVNKAYIIYNSEYKSFLWKGINDEVIVKFEFEHDNLYSYIDYRGGHPRFLQPAVNYDNHNLNTAFSSLHSENRDITTWTVYYNQTNTAFNYQNGNTHFYIDGTEYFYDDDREDLDDVDAISVSVTESTQEQNTITTIVSLREEVERLKTLVNELQINAIIKTNNPSSVFTRVPIGSVILYTGNTTSNYTKGKLYAKTASGWDEIV